MLKIYGLVNMKGRINRQLQEYGIYICKQEEKHKRRATIWKYQNAASTGI